MGRLLQRLAVLSPRSLLVRWWVLLLLLGLLSLVPPLEGIATAAAFCIFVGYPYALILGLPGGIVRSSIRFVARWLLMGFIGIILVMAVAIPFLPDDYATPTNPSSWQEWLEVALGAASVVVIFSPFFLGAAALNDTRRYMRQDSTLESIPNFLALYFGLFGGLLHVHRRVREVLMPANISLQAARER